MYRHKWTLFNVTSCVQSSAGGLHVRCRLLKAAELIIPSDNRRVKLCLFSRVSSSLAAGYLCLRLLSSSCSALDFTLNSEMWASLCLIFFKTLHQHRSCTGKMFWEVFNWRIIFTDFNYSLQNYTHVQRMSSDPVNPSNNDITIQII